MEYVSRFLSELTTDLLSVITQSFQVRFRNMEFFVVGVFTSLLCNFILAARASAFLQTAVIVTIISSITVFYAGFANEWKQVATSLHSNLLEMWNNVLKKVLLQLSTGAWNRIKEMAYNFKLSEFVTNLLDATVGRILPRFIVGNSDSSPVTEGSAYQKAKELFSACIMGIIVGTLVHLTIQVILYLLYTRVASMFFTVVLTTIQTLLDKFYLSTIIYSVCVALLSIAVVVVIIIRF